MISKLNKIWKDAVQDIWYKLPFHYIYRVYFKVFHPDFPNETAENHPPTERN
jgi:hypothetical protein